ncbi:MAG TPA: bifunctional UDP-N-acetylglucosamine diphosphorylase/glucosamine-1-phosphate N-acetyltransferase GlmU [Thermoleophilaceae bacterium]
MGNPTVLIMAAGHGTRMHSTLPKVLHPVCGRPMIHWVIDAARGAGAGRVVCVTRPGEGVEAELPDGVEVAEQVSGEGTGSAVLAARDGIGPDSTVVVLSGDHPLISSDLIASLVARHEGEAAAATLLTTDRIDPSGYGRVVRAPDNSVERIVETKYTDGVPEDELRIREINIGTYAFEAAALFGALDGVGETNGERYLTGVFPLISEHGGRIAAELTDDVLSALGVNTRADLMEVGRQLNRRLVEQHAVNGVTFTSPDTATLEAGVEIGEDTVVGPGVTIHAGTRVGSGCELGPHTTLIGAQLGDGVWVAHSYLVECAIENGARVGPFAYIRPGTVVREGAKVGTFVEVKNSDIGRGTKVPHLSYIGDADVGEEANIGAGNITANYNAATRKKSRTKIGNRAKTSVDTSFVAPVSVGDDAYTGAGSVITEDVPDGALGIARARQTNVDGYAQRKEQKASDEQSGD